MLKSQQAHPEPEELLLDYAERLTHHRAGRKALFLALSALVPTPHADGHWRVVENLLAPLVQRRGGELFRLRNGDVMAIFGSAERATLERLTHKLRYLFRDDPLIGKEEETGTELLCAWFDLVESYDAFLKLAREIHARRTPDAPTAILDPDALRIEGQEFRGAHDPYHAPLIRWLTAPAGGGVQTLERLVTAQHAAAPPPAAGPVPAFELLTPAPDALNALGIPPADLERNPELAAILLRLVARRLLRELPHMRKPAQRLAVAVGLDALYGAELLTFHRQWSAGRFEPVTFLLPYAEARADGLRFDYMCGTLRKLGHRIGVRDMPLDALGRRRALGADLYTLPWRLSYGDEHEASFAAIRDIFGHGDAQDILLTGVDSRQALAFARTQGVCLIAGRQASMPAQRA